MMRAWKADGTPAILDYIRIWREPMTNPETTTPPRRAGAGMVTIPKQLADKAMIAILHYRDTHQDELPWQRWDGYASDLERVIAAPAPADPDRPSRESISVIRQAIRDHYRDPNGDYLPISARIYADLVDAGHMQPYAAPSSADPDRPSRETVLAAVNELEHRAINFGRDLTESTKDEMIRDRTYLIALIERLTPEAGSAAGEGE